MGNQQPSFLKYLYIFQFFDNTKLLKGGIAIELIYEEFIQNILDTRGRFNCGDEYHERHHIVPKCMGGTNDEDNLIDLFAREHFIAHRLLALENSENHKLVYAWNRMCNSKNGYYQITPEEYEEARKTFSKMISGENNGMYGQTHTQEARDKISKIHKGKTLSDEHVDKLIEINSIPVAQYSLDGSLVQVWPSVREATRHLNCDHSSITQCCKRKLQTAHRFIWRYADQESVDDIIDTSFLSDCFKKIYQYTKDGQFIKEWDRQVDIVHELGISDSHLNACLKGKRKSTGGFVWKYKE